MRKDISLVAKASQDGIRILDTSLSGTPNATGQSRPLRSEQDALKDMLETSVSKFASNVDGGDDAPTHVVSPTTTPQNPSDNTKQLSPRADEMQDDRGATPPGEQVYRSPKISDSDARNYASLYKAMFSKTVNDNSVKLAAYRVHDNGEVELL